MLLLILISIVCSSCAFIQQLNYHQPYTSFFSSHRMQHHYSYTNLSTRCYAAKRRGGAMARRKKLVDTGFSKQKSIDETQRQKKDSLQSSSSNKTSADNIYSLPPLYDLAFGYRNYVDEVNFLLDAHDKYSTITNGQPLHILELAAGPARHAISALSEHSKTEVNSITALDISQDMVDYGIENANFDLGNPGSGRRDDFTYICGDMRNAAYYAQSELFDTAWILLGSMAHLLTNDDIISCLQSLHSIINVGGTVIIELPHPRETFCMGECTKNTWSVPLESDEELEYGELNIIWGDEDDHFDPVAQIRHFTVGLELTVNNIDDIPEDDDNTSPIMQMLSQEGKTKVEEIVPMRLYTLQEVDALARCAGFELVRKYGALANVSINDEDEAFRMVCILRRTS